MPIETKKNQPDSLFTLTSNTSASSDLRRFVILKIILLNFNPMKLNSTFNLYIFRRTGYVVNEAGYHQTSAKLRQALL